MKRQVGFAIGVGLVVVACTGQSDSSSTVGQAPKTTVELPVSSTSTSVADATTSTVLGEIESLQMCAGYRGGFSVSFDSSALDAYAEANEGVWGGWWVADGGEGPLVAVVTDEPGPHQGAIRQLVPEEVSIEVRQGTFTLEELSVAAHQLQDRDIPQLLTLHPSRWVNQVMIEVVADTPEVRKALVGLDPLLYCLAPHTGPVTSWGEQPQVGEVWRLLGESLASPSYFMSLAATEQGFETMWDRFFGGPVPEVDFGEEVVVYIGGVVSTGCPQIRLDELFIDYVGGVVYPIISRPEMVSWCRANALPHGYAIAVDRTALPDRFRLQFESVPYTYPGDIRDLEVDLTNPEQDTDVWGRPRVSVQVTQDDPDQVGLLTFRFYNETGRLITDPTGVLGEGPPVWGPYSVESGVVRLEVEVEVCGPDGCDVISRVGTCEITLPLRQYTDSTLTLTIPDLATSEEACSISSIEALLIDDVWVFTHQPYFYLQALHSGIPEIVDGCLTVGGVLVVWPIELLDTAAEAVAAAIAGTSTPITLGGGGSGLDQPLDPGQIPDMFQRCTTTALWMASP